MDLIVDANILFAALIKDSTTAKLFFDQKFHLFAPEYLLKEFAEHESEILIKTKRTRDEFSEVLEIIKSVITFIPREEVKSFILEAKTSSPDPDDAAYFAAAILLGAAIWSNDKKLKEQDKIRVISTEELIKLI